MRALSTAVPGVPGIADIKVEPGNLLQVAKIINDQADELDDRLRGKLADLSIEPPADDVVSTTATEAWNRLVARGEGSYAVRVQAYVKNLRDLAAQLREAAKHYHTGDEDNAAAFGDRGAGRI
ncbi:type VII secretion target [Amycolatopsis pigmentata]|uniref:Type VII secretion target n=1 Tax=Amycolatopsis pigmentata TaxID=450801 RepID=A0ABW5FUD6_9PSEU